MSEGRVVLAVDGAVATVLFDRPAARNAMSWAMYRQLVETCATIDADPSIRAVVFRGSQGAFVAGTEISQFLDFSSGEDGVRYEEAIEETLQAFLRLRVPTLAVIEGAAVGGGLLLAAGCDIRISTPRARFGVPVARTLGNCLTIRNLDRLVDAFGLSRVQRMLYLAELLDATEARTAGFLAEIVEPEALEARLAALAAALAAHAPHTLQATKEALRRLAAAPLPDDRDLVRRCYGSADFREGVRAFTGKRPPRWEGR